MKAVPAHIQERRAEQRRGERYRKALRRSHIVTMTARQQAEDDERKAALAMNPVLMAAAEARKRAILRKG